MTKKPSPFILSKTDLARVEAAFDEMQHIESRFQESMNLRQNLEQAAENYLYGETSLFDALLLRGFDHRLFDEEVRALRTNLKDRMRAMPDKLADIILAHKQHLAAESAADLAAAEEAEHKAFRACGVCDEDYRESAKVERLRAQLEAAQTQVGLDPARRDLDALFIATGHKSASE